MIGEEQRMAAMGSIVQQQEYEILSALHCIENRLWSLDEVKRRCQIIRRLDDPKGAETLVIDGKPMVEFYPMNLRVEVTDTAYKLIIDRPFRRLYSPPTSSGEKS